MYRKLIIVLTLLLITVGCGQKGPLYLPDDEQQSAKRRYGPF